MIITKKKPIEEVLAMLDGADKILLTGCSECATVCQTGGETQLQEMKEALEAAGKTVVGVIYPQLSCNKLLMKKELKPFKGTYDAVLSLSCGDGTQTVASNTETAVYPGNNTMFLGEIERLTIFTEACKMCGDCVLGSTGGICPITKCAKSLINGPCGGARDGKCEVNPDNPCAWIEIYKKLKQLGQLDKFENLNDDKSHANFSYPRTINLKEGEE